MVLLSFYRRQSGLYKIREPVRFNDAYPLLCVRIENTLHTPNQGENAIQSSVVLEHGPLSKHEEKPRHVYQLTELGSPVLKQDVRPDPSIDDGMIKLGSIRLPNRSVDKFAMLDIKPSKPYAVRHGLRLTDKSVFCSALCSIDTTNARKNWTSVCKFSLCRACGVDRCIGSSELNMENTQNRIRMITLQTGREADSVTEKASEKALCETSDN